ARPGGAGRAGAIVAGVLSAAGGYVLGSVRARRGGATFSVVEIPDGRGDTA
ncbi:glycosyltransferase family 2 protein, partial [Streptomyces sp. NPDC001795]